MSFRLQLPPCRGLFGLGLGFAVAVAGTAGTVGWTDATPVRVYTNADLEKFAVAEPVPDSQVTPPTEDWEFVQGFIERERESIRLNRLDDLARQSLEAERRAADAAEAAAERREPSYRYAPIYRPWQGLFSSQPARIGGFRDRPHDDAKDRDPSAEPDRPRQSRPDWIVPLHARRPHRR